MNLTNKQIETLSLMIMDDVSRTDVWDTIESPKDFQDILKVNISKSNLDVDDITKEDMTDIVSQILTSSYKEYQIFETDRALMNLIDKGLIKMSVNQSGELVYETTELGNIANKMLGDEEL